MPEARRYQPVRVVEEFRRSLMRELDLAAEARNIERFARNFQDEPYVLIPHVYPQWTSEADERAGAHRWHQPRRPGGARRAPASIPSCSLQRGADSVLKMILEDGFFHADPHPGNVIYLPGNRIAMIDFGMVGRLSPARRNQIIDLLAGIARHDSSRCSKCCSTGPVTMRSTRSASPPTSTSS